MEWGRWVGTQFFPSHEDLKRALDRGRLCLASKTRTLGDALMAAAIARKLKARYPDLSIYTYNRAFNPIVTRQHPSFSGIAWFPRAVFGDDCNWGSGHLIQLKENWFGLETSSNPRPEIFLSKEEENHASEWLRSHQLEGPLLFIHPWGHTWTQVLSSQNWADLIRPYHGRFQIVQLGVAGQNRIEGVDATFFAGRSPGEARLLFALIAQASGFIGVNSGPMHVAKSFEIPSLVLIQEGEPEEIFRRRFEFPYFLNGNPTRGFLYESNQHFCLKSRRPSELNSIFEKFLHYCN